MHLICGLIAGHQAGRIDLENIIDNAAAEHRRRRIRREEIMGNDREAMLQRLRNSGASDQEIRRLMERLDSGNSGGPVDVSGDMDPLAKRAHYRTIEEGSK